MSGDERLPTVTGDGKREQGGDRAEPRSPPSWVVALSDGGQVAQAFQCGALLALRALGLLRDARVLTASG